MAAGETETIEFSYEVDDGLATSGVQTATIIITGENDDPTANDDSDLIGESGTSDLDLLVNDTDPDGSDVLSVTSVDGNAVDTVFSVTSNDVFVFEDNNGADTIADFNTGFSEADKIDLSALTTIPDVDLSGTTNFADLSISDAGGGHALIDFGGGNSITLLNTNWVSLTDTDFIF